MRGVRRRAAACRLWVSKRGVPDYNVAELSSEHIIMVLLGEGEGTL